MALRVLAIVAIFTAISAIPITADSEHVFYLDECDKYEELHALELIQLLSPPEAKPRHLRCAFHVKIYNNAVVTANVSTNFTDYVLYFYGKHTTVAPSKDFKQIESVTGQKQLSFEIRSFNRIKIELYPSLANSNNSYEFHIVLFAHQTELSPGEIALMAMGCICTLLALAMIGFCIYKKTHTS